MASTFWSEERSDERRKVLAAAPAVQSSSIRFMVFHRCHTTQLDLVTPCIVVSDVFFYRRDQFGLIRKLAEIVHLGFQDSPPALHRTVINASSDTGHTLYHSCIYDLFVKCFVGILWNCQEMCSQRIPKI